MKELVSATSGRKKPKKRLIFEAISQTPPYPPDFNVLASRRPYPVSSGSAAIRRTILLNNPLVRWLSANKSQ
jgi:hypothetical protein